MYAHYLVADAQLATMYIHIGTNTQNLLSSYDILTSHGFRPERFYTNVYLSQLSPVLAPASASATIVFSTILAQGRLLLKGILYEIPKKATFKRLNLRLLFESGT